MINQTSPFRFSVIIPLEFHRGQIEACLRRWAHEQTYARDQYEIIAVGCHSSLGPAALSNLENLLGPYDRLLLYDKPHDMSLCAYAAWQAKGEVLFFTESHCLPEINILSIADQTLQVHPEWAGFSCRSIRLTHNLLSIVEADMYEADIRYSVEGHPWRKIVDQCFVVRTERYQNAGGFLPELGHFAEWHLAAKMHQQGDQIGYQPEAQVWHRYVGDDKELIEFSEDFAQGEMTYHAEVVNNLGRSYFQEPTEWRRRYQWVPQLAGNASALAWQARSKFSFNHRKLLIRSRWLLEWRLRASQSTQPAIKWAYLRFRLARWRLHLGLFLRLGTQPLRTMLVRLIDATVRLERLRFIQHWLKQRAAQDQALHFSKPASVLVWQPECSHTFCSVGFHAVEEWHGRQFQWSEPLGMIEVSLVPGNYRFVIEWLPITPIDNLILYLGEEPISFVREACKASSFIQIDSDHPLCFSWTCEPLASSGDSRLLGLPVALISWTSSLT